MLISAYLGRAWGRFVGPWALRCAMGNRSFTLTVLSEYVVRASISVRKFLCWPYRDISASRFSVQLPMRGMRTVVSERGMRCRIHIQKKLLTFTSTD